MINLHFYWTVGSIHVLPIQASCPCWTNFRCHDGFSCSADQDAACIDRHCTCLTTHTCTHTSDCRDISACRANLRHHEICYQGKCHCADITDVIGGVVG
ncbi:hypothetical protein ACJMK2_004641 [Sinanodonta woodiana]|uniref:Uncharacterized protein n=1 Tax=Sinanodonta woodiana TaxID=1069815 RepID=A0ABD3Y1W4_SINWO